MPKHPSKKNHKSSRRELWILLFTFLLILFLRLRGDHSDSRVASSNSPGQIRLLLGVVTTWDKIERRHLIRHLYPLSQKNLSGTTGSDVVRTIFVIGEPKSETASAILKWESEMYGDIMILDGIDENMNTGKTFHFFKALHDWRILYQDGGWTHVGKIDDDTWYIPLLF
jgi:Galactosyltransferase